MDRHHYDLIGQRFGRLVVVERAENNKRGLKVWRCKCDCGNYKDILGTRLRSGKTKSCGCLAVEMATNLNLIHGDSYSRLHYIWRSMKSRCNNPKSERYPNYGARGIKVCEEWGDSFVAFRDWALANGYAENLTIDRKDIGGDYCPENCRWISAAEQMRNTTRTHFITYNGETLSLPEWAERMNMSQKTLTTRLCRNWSIERALTTPVRRW